MYKKILFCQDWECEQPDTGAGGCLEHGDWRPETKLKWRIKFKIELFLAQTQSSVNIQQFFLLIISKRCGLMARMPEVCGPNPRLVHNTSIMQTRTQNHASEGLGGRWQSLLSKYLQGKYFIKIFARYGNIIVDAVTENVLRPPISLEEKFVLASQCMTTHYHHILGWKHCEQSFFFKVFCCLASWPFG